MEVCSSREYCLGQQCSEFSRCHLTRVRNEAARAQVLVVNHHLFFADLALRSKEIAPVIPEYDAIVFDEAHQLEGVIADYFGIHFGSAGLDQLARDILRECRRETKKLDLKPVRTAGQQLEVLSRLFHHHLLQQSRGGVGRYRFESGRTGEEFRNTTRQISHALEELPAMIMPFAEQMETLGCLGRQGGTWRSRFNR